MILTILGKNLVPLKQKKTEDRDEGTMETAIHKAIREKDTAAVMDMIGTLTAMNDHNINALNPVAQTPLQALIQRGFFKIAEALIERWMSGDFELTMDKADLKGDTEIHLCIKHNAPRNLLERFVELGANVDKPNNRRLTPLLLCLRHDPPMALALITGDCDIEGPKGTIRPILANDRYPAVTIALIEAKARIDVTDEKGNTPLHLAVAYDWPNVVSLLTKKGANVNARNARRQTPIHLARCIQTLDALLRTKQVEINATGDDGESMLLWSVENSSRKMCMRLIKANANVNSSDKSGDSIIKKAVLRGDAKVCSALIARGALVREIDSTGNTLLHHVQDPSICEMLIAAGCPMNVLNRYGETAVFRAIDYNREGVCLALLKKGGDPQTGDVFGTTPLHSAYKCNTPTNAGPTNSWAIAPLLKAGANPNTPNRNGRTPIFCVTNPEDVMTLIEGGANFAFEDNYGSTPLHLHAFEGRNQVNAIYCHSFFASPLIPIEYVSVVSVLIQVLTVSKLAFSRMPECQLSN